MAKRRILRLSYFVATLPYIILSKFAFKFNWWGFKNDVITCSDVAQKFDHIELSTQLLDTLIIAEDHRNNFHYGIDQISLCRAIYRTITGFTQGASTIEQQFVRVSTNRYQRTIKRKLLEQLLAVYLSSYLKKERIAVAYLSIAFYGHGKFGLNNITSSAVDTLKYEESILIVSRLKYPEPSVKTKRWLVKFTKRNKHIAEQLKAANTFIGICAHELGKIRV